jgi:hypothetical protein
MNTNEKILTLLGLIDDGYSRKTWHGPNLRGSLRGVTVDQALWRPARSRHNIWEIAVHAAYWKYTVRRRILGEVRGSFPLKGSNWFVRPAAGEATNDDWRRDLALLTDVHHSMRAAIAALKPNDLRTKATGSVHTIEATIRGIAMHDVYHAGQIQLLKRLQRS